MFNYMLHRYSITYHDKLIKLLKPLEEHLTVKHFCYYKITNTGHYHFIASHLTFAEYYYDEKQYLNCPYLLHPDNYQTGISLSRSVSDPLFQESQEKTYKIFNMNIALTFLDKTDEGVEGFAFATDSKMPFMEAMYVNEIPIFKHFIRVFKEDFKPIIQKMDEDNIDLSLLVGHDFFNKKVDFTLRVKDREELLKKMGVSIPLRLTRKEKEVAMKIASGYTAKEIGMLMHLSQRTIEHYIDILKMAFHCTSKSELVLKTQELMALGYFH